MEEKIFISIVEDDENIFLRLKDVITHSKSFELLDYYSTAELAIQHLSGKLPDILIVDLGLPGMSGVNCIKILREKKLNIKIIVYTVFEDENSILSAIRAGADAYILKDTPKELFIADLNVVYLGGSTLTPKVAEKIIKDYKPLTTNACQMENPLTKREIEILNLISFGFTYSEIADDLEVSIHTVRRHIEKLYKKLKVNSKTQAMIKGKQFGLLEDN